MSDISDHLDIASLPKSLLNNFRKDRMGYSFKRNTSKDNYNAFISELTNYNWQQLCNKSSVNEACTYFIDVINALYDKT